MTHKPYAPSDVVVIEVKDGCYSAYVRTTDGSTPIHVPAPEKDEHVTEWAMGLDDNQLAAAVQIYYDNWNFHDGGEDAKLRLDAVEAERKRRKLPHATFAPGVFARV